MSWCVSNIEGPFRLRKPARAGKWLWICHRCGRMWPLATTRRCLADGHYYCKTSRRIAKSIATAKSPRRLGTPRAVSLPAIPRQEKAPRREISSRAASPRSIPPLEFLSRATSPPYFCPRPPQGLDLSYFLNSSEGQALPRPVAIATAPRSRELSPSTGLALASMDKEWPGDEEASPISPTVSHEAPFKPFDCASLGDDTPALVHSPTHTATSHRTPLPSGRTPLPSGNIIPPSNGLPNTARQAQLLAGKNCSIVTNRGRAKRQDKAKKRASAACSSRFDVVGWRRWNDWRRGNLYLKQLYNEDMLYENDVPVQVEESRKRKRGGVWDESQWDCSIDCDFPAHCRKPELYDDHEDGEEGDKEGRSRGDGDRDGEERRSETDEGEDVEEDKESQSGEDEDENEDSGEEDKESQSGEDEDEDEDGEDEDEEGEDEGTEGDGNGDGGGRHLNGP